MSEHQSGPVELGAPMDYPEHEKTYNGFIAASKYGTIMVVALLIAMAAGFFTAAGFVSSLILFLVLSIGGIFMFR